MAKQIIVTQNNYGIVLETQFLDSNKNPIDLTNYCVEVKIENNGAILDVVTAEITGTLASIILNKEHTKEIGLYKTEWCVMDLDKNITAQEDIYYFVKSGITSDKEEEKEDNININTEDVIFKFKELDEKVNVLEISEKNIGEKIQNINSSLESSTIDFNKETVLITSFNGVNGTKLDLYLTNDGENLIPLHFNEIFKTNFNGENVNRDFSIIKLNGYYYLTYGTNILKNGSYIDVIGFAKTKDFINYDSWYYEVNGYNKVWAPHFYLEDEQVYILVSLNTESKMTQHYLKATDKNLNTFESPKILLQNTSFSSIDASIYNELNKLQLFIKDEDRGILKHFTSSILSIENANWIYVNDLDFKSDKFSTIEVEGGSLVKINNIYHLYGCKFAEEKSAVIKSVDLMNWSEPVEVKNKFGLRTKHFDALKLNYEDKKVIQNFMNKNNGNSIFSLWEKHLKPWYTILQLDNYVQDKVFTPSKEVINALYVTGGEVTINHIKTDTYSNTYNIGSNHYKLNNIKLMAFNTGKITLKNQIDTNNIPYLKQVICPSLKDFVISKNDFNSEEIIELERLSYHDKFYRIKNTINSNALINLNCDTPVILRRSIGSAVAINSSDYVNVPALSYNIEINKKCLVEFNGTISLRNLGDIKQNIKVLVCFGNKPSDVEMYEVFASGCDRMTLPLTAYKYCNSENTTLNIYVSTSEQDIHIYRFKGVLKRTLVNDVIESKKYDYNAF